MKGVIIAAGYGSRFLPVTKTIPKEMLPLYNLPLIHFAITELVEAKITDIIVVTSRRKKCLDDYLDVEFELENFFRGTSKEEVIKPFDANVCFVRQKRMMGVGDAILEASSFIGRDSFILLYPDDIVISSPPLSKRLVEAHRSTGKNVISIVNKKGEDLSRFGVVKATKLGSFFKVDGIVEKPKNAEELPPYISIGRYLFTSEFIEILKEEKSKFDGKGEFHHISSINRLCSEGKVIGVEVTKEEFFDTGTPLEYLKSLVRYSASYSDVRDEVRKWLKDFVERSLRKGTSH